MQQNDGEGASAAARVCSACCSPWPIMDACVLDNVCRESAHPPASSGCPRCLCAAQTCPAPWAGTAGRQAAGARAAAAAAQQRRRACGCVLKQLGAQLRTHRATPAYTIRTWNEHQTNWLERGSGRLAHTVRADSIAHACAKTAARRPNLVSPQRHAASRCCVNEAVVLLSSSPVLPSSTVLVGGVPRWHLGCDLEI